MSGENGTQVLDAEVVDEDVETQAVVPTAPAGAALAVVPQASPKDLVARLDAIKETQLNAMEEDVDYGVIPGTSGKPTLYKAGAEKLGVLFQLDIQLENSKRWEGDGHLTVISKATVFHAPTGARLGYGEGICSTRERKYAYRTAQRTCPNCGAEAIIKGKQEYGGGWLCFARKGGCGAKWDDGAQEIEGQSLGQVDNPDLADTWNTVVKMAAKRARVDAVLAVTGASAIFTQDLEDQAPTGDDAPKPEQQKRQPQNGNGNKAAPQTKAEPRQSSAKPISGAQKGKINALLAEGGATESQADAIRYWWTGISGCDHYDRLPSRKASELIDALGENGEGVTTILDEISLKAEQGHHGAQRIVNRLAEIENGGGS